MMSILQLLENDNTIFIKKETEGRIIICYKKISNDMIDFDMCLKLVYEKNGWNLYEIQRDKEYLIKQSLKKEIGFIAFFTAVKSYFNEDIPSVEVKKYIRSFEGDYQSLHDYLVNIIREKNFSFFEDKEGRVNIKKTNDTFEIYYLTLTNEKVPIIKNKKSPSAFIVLYNYSFYLKQFNECIYPLAVANNLTIQEIEELKKIYFKK